jgi:cyclic pyranopterin phosphate synthase
MPSFLRVIKLLVTNGVSKVRLTGGEPTLRSDLPQIVSDLKAMSGLKHVGITTNGFVLARMANSLAEAGLDSVNISLDSLNPGKFAFITKVDGFSRVWKGIETSLGLFPTVKLNVVVMKGFNEDELADFVELAGKFRITIRFIEYMPFPGNAWSLRKFISLEDMKKSLSARFSLIPADAKDPIAEYYDIAGQAGRIGFISSISQPFCEACNRIRITSDGFIKVCLHDDEEKKLDLSMSDEELLQEIRAVLVRKRLQHDPAAQLVTAPNRSMVNIGG